MNKPTLTRSQQQQQQCKNLQKLRAAVKLEWRFLEAFFCEIFLRGTQTIAVACNRRQNARGTESADLNQMPHDKTTPNDHTRTTTMVVANAPRDPG
eukprot:SAG31_NODE_1079_length_10031_cov_5.270741_1_plen_95_part_10